MKEYREEKEADPEYPLEKAEFEKKLIFRRD